MTINDFILRFDVLYNNITSNQAPGLNDYEKSVFLTKAQEELVKNYFLPQSNAKQEGFQGNKRREYNFSNLIYTKAQGSISDTNKIHRRDNSYLYTFPKNQIAIVQESVDRIIEVQGKSTTQSLQVTPLSLEEYQRLMLKPYKAPVKGQVWRLFNNGYAELIFREADIKPTNSYTYTVTYVKRPKPIVLGDFSDLGVSGDLTGEPSTGELDESMHEEILQRAVELAKVAWFGDLNATLQTGQRSE